MKLRGAMTALVTPFTDDQVDHDALTKLCQWQIEQGIHGLVAVGTTGESATLSQAEQVAVIQTTVKAAAGKVPVVAGAGANSTRVAIEKSKAAEEAGADALLQVVPPYNKPTQEGLYQHFAAIHEATTKPIVLYNVPGRTVCDMSAETAARLSELPRIVAIKEATADMARASKIVELCGDSLGLLSGDDFTTFPLLALGGQGVISVISNLMPKEMSGMCDAAAAGDWDKARSLHYKMQPLLDLMFVEANPIPAKAALAMMGRMKADVRLPLVAATSGLEAKLRERLAEAGLGQ